MDSENLRNLSPDLQRVREPVQIITFITDPREVPKILEHIGEQTSCAPPLMLTDPVPSFSVLGDTNFQYSEVPWDPDPPAFDH